ncbi:MAG: fla [Clostridiales bacterium]|jgi:flagellin|nr:fla [Clostridiales bacterium]
MIINHNIAALNTYRQLTSVNNMTSKSLEKLSSGYRINRAGDDAAGLAISEKMRGQIRGLEMASKNAQDGISLIQTAEGALNETHSILQRMRELAVQSASDTNTEADRKELQKEVDQLASELSRISNNTEFNTKNLLGGAFEGTFQIGANENQNLELSINAMDAFTLGLTENVASVSARNISNNSGNAGGNLQGADLADNQYLIEGTYTVEVTQNGSNVDIKLKDSDGNVVASKINWTAAAGEVTLDTVGDGSGTSVITLSYASATAAGDSATLEIGANGADLDESQAAGNTGTVAAVEMSATNLLDKGSYTITAKSDGTTVDILELRDSNGNLLGSYDNSDTALAANTNYTIALADGSGSVTITTGGVAAADGDVFSFTVVQSDYKSGASSAAVDSDGNGVLDKEAYVAKGIDIRTQANADAAITKINKAIEVVSAERSKLGAYQNRLEHTINNLGTSAENLTAAESRIRDVDYAEAA